MIKRAKKITAWCLALCLALSLLPGLALAEEYEDGPAAVEETDAAPVPGAEETAEEETAAAAVPEAEKDTPKNPDAPPEAEISEDTEELVWEEVSADGVFQAGAITGPQTLPDEPAFFARETLDSKLYAALLAEASSLDVGEFSIQTSAFNSEFNKVLNNHPDLYHVNVSGCRYYSSSSGIVTNITLAYNNLRGSAYRAKFNAAVDKALAEVKTGMSDLEKALVLHDYLVVNCRYNWEVATVGTTADETVWSAYGVLVNQDAVCQGYALTYKYLLNKESIDAVIVTSNQINHAWNAVNLDGEWYYVDATWDDPMPDTEGKCSHQYFLWMEDSPEGESHRTVEKNGQTYLAEKDWTPVYNCNSGKYQSGYAFNDNVWPLYYMNDTFYYIKRVSGMSYRVLQGALGEVGTPVGEDFRPYVNQTTTDKGTSYYFDYFSVVWVDDNVYYIAYPDKKLHARSLITGEEKTSDTETELTGRIGLRYKNGQFETTTVATSAADYGKTIDIFSYFKASSIPSAWETGDPRICGLTENNTKIGVKWDRSENATVYAAVYSNGKMTSVQAVSVALKDGITLVELPKAIAGSTWKLFLAGENRPLCKALSSSD